MTDVTDVNRRSVLVLDAMGVIYRAGNDVAELLIPFIREKGGTDDADRIDAAYREASLGRITAAAFWRQVGVPHEWEDEYLRRHVVTDGVAELLERAQTRFERVYCLSNDVSEWSRKLRRWFQLEPHFAGWYISGELGLRKPDARIYAHLLAKLAVDPKQVVFVDDRVKNLDPAAALGIHTVHYNVGNSRSDSGHQTITKLAALVEG